MMYAEIRNKIDSLFRSKSKELEIENGDISPEDTAKLDMATELITDVMNKWIKNNLHS